MEKNTKPKEVKKDKNLTHEERYSRVGQKFIKLSTKNKHDKELTIFK